MSAIGLLLSLLWIFNATRAASFYGSSYISMPLQEARSTTDLSFRFKTGRPDALLFLAAGRTDYCLVVLQAGALKVRINLGAGEAEVATPRGLRLDDLTWHEVRIHRKDADFTLTVDAFHSSKLRLPGRFYELNIHYGLFLGGLGDFREIFLGLWDNFRGCIQDLHYNGVDVLAKIQDKTIQADPYGVTWDCSGEFEASSLQDISFLATDSYVTFAGLLSKTGSSLKFALKTQTREAVLVYSTGPPAKPDFLAVELVEGHLRASMDSGGGVLEVFSDTAVNDGLWHQTELQWTLHSIDIIVDGRSNSVRSAANTGRYFEWTGNLYLGGIELHRQSRALNQGIRTGNSSLRGCIRKLDVDGRILGLREARVTRHVQPDCVWEYPCLRNPCLETAVCHQDGTLSFRCECDQATCTKPEFLDTQMTVTKSGPPSTPSSTEVDIIHTTALQVSEGGTVTLTSAQLTMILDYEKFGIRESGILLHIVRPPQYGRLFSALWRRADEATFTLLDVHSDRILYVHDGSETTKDSVVLELELAPQAGFLLPAYLQKRRRVVLNINVTPVNDPPELSLPPGKILRLVKNTRKPLTADLLTAVDPDNLPSDLTYSILNSKSGSDIEGYVENIQQPGTSILSFSQEEINEGKIWFVHRGSPSGRLALRVSDGLESGPTAVLRISAFDLQLFLMNNSGLIVPLNGSTFLTLSNLTFATNAPDQELDIRFDITRNPQYGSVQKWKANNPNTPGGKWQTISWFSSLQLQRERIRYIHLNGTPTQDDFKFSVSVPEADFRSSTIYEFRIQFLINVLRAEKNDILLMKGNQDVTISSFHLKYITDPDVTAEEDIVYTLVQVPSFGSLWLSPSGKDSKRQKLNRGSKFTQAMISTFRLQYRLARRTLSPLRDSFEFQVSTAFLTTTTPQIFRISYTPNIYQNASTVLETVVVNEGESSSIRSQQLSISMPGSSVVNYTVIRSPRHGSLNLLDSTKRLILRRNITSFTSQEIHEDRVVYTHDDSESTGDDLEFLAVPKEPVQSDSDFQYIGLLTMNVRMKNDNPPVRVIDQVLHVVTNEQRILSGSILKYSDPDINTKPADIVYTRRNIPNGALYHTDRQDLQIFQFTQADLDERKILFKHQGSSYGRIALWITDGQFHTTGILEVQASDPFLKIVNSSSLIVKRGNTGALSTANIGIHSNMDFNAEELSFHVLEKPQFGSIEIDGSKVESFHQSDILAGTVYYSSENQVNFKDKFKYRASLRKAETEGTLDVRIYPESYWQPLKVLHNKMLYVEESTSVTVDQSSLKVFIPNIAPSEIVFYVVRAPLHGYLEIDHDESDPDETDDAVQKRLPPEVMVFDQSIINENRLHYIQSGANQTADLFLFNVTNGISSLSNISFHLAIIPKYVYLETKEIQVLEGGQAPLTGSDIRILTQYYADKVDEILITRLPLHGSIQLQRPDVDSVEVVNKFTWQQLLDKHIVYVHDGSENSQDNVEIVVVAADKESLPATLHIKVKPVDDEKPSLVNNTGITVWEGASVVLEPSRLGATDADTEPPSIYFTLTQADCGYIAVSNKLADAVVNFTQQQINDGQIAFVHHGQANCSLNISLTDGYSVPVYHSVAVTSRKLRLLLQRNIQLHVFPMMQQSITSSHLLVVTNDFHPERVTRFKVTRPPRLGRLLLEQPDGSTKLVTSFTQRDLNQSLLIYEHTEPFPDLSVNDSFIFTVSNELTSPLVDQEFRIEISVTTMAEGGLDRYLGLTPLQTEEGGVVAIQQNNFNLSGIIQFITSHRGAIAVEPPKLRVTLSRTPQHGFISVMGNRIEAGNDISVNSIASNNIRYHHDHSDTTQDSFGLTIFLQRDEPEEKRPDIMLYNGTLRVNILPVNDQVFVLVTKAPAMQVVQRQSRPITNDILLTEDADTAPKDILYDIIQPPSHGKLSFADNLTATVVRFSQEDINKQRVVYLHDGTMESTSFYFRVSDGQFKPVTGVFTIHFVPLSLKLVNSSVIHIQQGHTTVVIGNSSMGADSNGLRRHIFYNITQEPQYGRIYVNDAAVSTFGQSNIDKEEVLYVQLNMSASSDWFQVTIWNLEISIPNQIFNISVAPLVHQLKIRAVVGEKTPITPSVLDAGKLALLTNSNPTFNIVRKPKYGKLRKIVPSSNRVKRQAKEKDASLFTHEDIQNEFIYYVIKKLDVNDTVVDTCEYLLIAPNVQPASGVLEFTLLPSGTHVAASKSSIDIVAPNGAGNTSIRRPQKTEKQPVPDIVTENTLSAMGVSTDVILIVGVLCGILILALIILVVVRCHIKQHSNKKQKTGTNQSNGGDMQLHRLTGSLKNGHKKGMSDFEITDAYRIPRSLNRETESELDSDPEPPPPPRLDIIDPPLSPRPPRARRIASPVSNSSTMSSLQGRARGSWHDSARETPPSVPQCKIIPLNPLMSGSESETSELVNARYPYGVADDSLEEWAMLEPDVRFTTRTTNPCA